MTKYSMCNNYLSAIIVLHKFYGHDCDFCQNFLKKLVLRGLKSVLGDTTFQKRPFTIDEFLAMNGKIQLDDELNVISSELDHNCTLFALCCASLIWSPLTTWHMTISGCPRFFEKTFKTFLRPI